MDEARARTGGIGRLSRGIASLAARRERSVARRAHDQAMELPGMAAEHDVQVTRSLLLDKKGCEFCG
jgi:hypothetical protein